MAKFVTLLILALTGNFHNSNAGGPSNSKGQQHKWRNHHRFYESQTPIGDQSSEEYLPNHWRQQSPRFFPKISSSVPSNGVSKDQSQNRPHSSFLFSDDMLKSTIKHLPNSRTAPWVGFAAPTMGQLQGALTGHVNTSEAGLLNLKCMNQQWVVPAGVYQCCGAALYRPSLEQCSQPGDIIVSHKVNQRNEKARFQAESKTSNSANPFLQFARLPAIQTLGTKIIICKNHRYAIPVRSQLLFSCCGNRAYHVQREMCLDGVVRTRETLPLLSTTTTINPEKKVDIKQTEHQHGRNMIVNADSQDKNSVSLICDGVEYWVDSRRRQFYSECSMKMIALYFICR